MIHLPSNQQYFEWREMNNALAHRNRTVLVNSVHFDTRMPV